MNKPGIISYLCAAGLAFAVCGCTETKHSSAPKAQGGNSTAALSTNGNSSSNRGVASKPQPQPENPKITVKQASVVTNRPAPVSPAASPRSGPQPETRTIQQPETAKRKMTVQTNAQNSDLPADALVIRADPEKSVSKGDASQTHLALTRFIKHKSFKWVMAVGVLGLAFWYVRRRGGSKAASKPSLLPLPKSAGVPVTDFPTE
jgi:hypothetical protein